MKSIFIVGEQRSGSNLLRLMLSQAGIAAPHPPHLLARMLPLVPSYGNLGDDRAWEQLVHDACELVERNPVPWHTITRFDRTDVDRRCRERSLYAIFGALMDTYAETLGSNAWACKSMQYCRYGEDLDAYFGDPLYIYLYRDGRDVTLSFTKAVIGEKHPYFVAKQWSELQHICLAEQERVGSDRYFSICYEELIQEPEPVLRELCDFLSVDFTPAMLSFHSSSEAKVTSEKSQLWQNLNRPVMRDNSRKFLKGLGKEEIAIVESVSGNALDALGYDRVQIMPGDERVFSPEHLAAFAELNDLRKQELKPMMDEDDVQRRAHQLEILTERVYFLSDFSQSDVLRFLAFAVEEHHEDGTIILEKGEVSRAVYFIAKGEATVLEGTQEVAMLQTGEPFGEIAALTGIPRTRTIRASGPVRLFRLSWERWNTMRTDAPDLAANVLWAISTRLAERFQKATSN